MSKDCRETSRISELTEAHEEGPWVAHSAPYEINHQAESPMELLPGCQPESDDKPQDLRVRKTVAAIEGTLLRLLRTHDFDQVTVSMICKEALVNKGTFYRHFQDKYDLADRVKLEKVDRFRSTLESLQQAAGDDRNGAVVSHLLAATEEGLEDLTHLRWIRSGVNLEVELWKSAYAILTTTTEWKDKDPHDVASVAWVIIYLALGYPEYRRQVSDPMDLYHYFLTANKASDLYRLEHV